MAHVSLLNVISTLEGTLRFFLHECAEEWFHTTLGYLFVITLVTNGNILTILHVNAAVQGHSIVIVHLNLLL